MNIKLSNRQKEVYDYIKSYVKKYEYSPHVIEIKKHFGYSAHSTVIQHLKALEKKGYIKVAYKQKRGIHLLDGDKPLRNTVLFPQQVIPIYIGREKSLKLISDIDLEKSKYIIVVAQEDGSIEEPSIEDL